MRRLQHPAGGRLVAIVATGLAMGSMGCLGSSPNISLYTMSAQPAPAVAGASDDLAIGVGPIRVPRYLDRPEWVTRPVGSASRLDVDDYRQWAGGFASNVLSVLAQDLGSRLGTQRVVAYPATAPFPLDYRVAVDFLAFEAVEGEALEVRASWLIRTGKAGGGSWVGQSTMRRPIANQSPEALVAAYNEALALLADEIAARIAGLPRGEAGSEPANEPPPG
jgi:uncharacterized lipoprotein YmbA